MQKRICIKTNCDAKVRVRGLCAWHYDRAIRAGTLELEALPSRHASTLTDLDLEAGTCTCPIHGAGARIRTRTRKSGRVKHVCRRCDRGGSSRPIDPAQRRAARLRQRYGITAEEFDLRLQAQQGKCLICRCEIDEQAAAVDHCHALGHVRGLLCQRCNIGLGWFNDDPSRLDRAARYLRQYAKAAG